MSGAKVSRVRRASSKYYSVICTAVRAGLGDARVPPTEGTTYYLLLTTYLHLLVEDGGLLRTYNYHELLTMAARTFIFW